FRAHRTADPSGRVRSHGGLDRRDRETYRRASRIVRAAAGSAGARRGTSKRRLGSAAADKDYRAGQEQRPRADNAGQVIGDAKLDGVAKELADHVQSPDFRLNVPDESRR